MADSFLAFNNISTFILIYQLFLNTKEMAKVEFSPKNFVMVCNQIYLFCHASFCPYSVGENYFHIHCQVKLSFVLISVHLYHLWSYMYIYIHEIVNNSQLLLQL